MVEAGRGSPPLVRPPTPFYIPSDHRMSSSSESSDGGNRRDVLADVHWDRPNQLLVPRENNVVAPIQNAAQPQIPNEEPVNELVESQETIVDAPPAPAHVPMDLSGEDVLGALPPPNIDGLMFDDELQQPDEQNDDDSFLDTSDIEYYNEPEDSLLVQTSFMDEAVNGPFEIDVKEPGNQEEINSGELPLQVRLLCSIKKIPFG